MNTFQIETNDTVATLHLSGEVTIEEARALQVALRTALLRPRKLVIETSALGRVDAAVLQVVLAGVRSAVANDQPDPSPAWTSALERYALAAAFARN